MQSHRGTVPGTESVLTGVVTALTLGWHVAELYHFERLPGESDPHRAGHLPGLGRLPARDRAAILAMQIETGLQVLGQTAFGQLQVNGKALAGEIDTSQVDAQVEAAPVKPETLKPVVAALHEQFLKALTARSSAAGKAYGLGRALAETMLLSVTDDPTTFAEQFELYRIRTLQGDLSDLKGRLPPYAADAVSYSLERWATWVADHNLNSGTVQWTTRQKQQVGQTLRRQGQVWYGLLDGEIDPVELLQPIDYVTAAQCLVGQIGELGWEFLTGTWIGGLFGCATVLVSLLLVLLVVTDRGAAVGGTAVLLLGSFGITAAGIVSSARQALSQVQSPLWKTELVTGVGQRTLHLPSLTSSGIDEPGAAAGEQQSG